MRQRALTTARAQEASQKQLKVVYERENVSIRNEIYRKEALRDL